MKCQYGSGGSKPEFSEFVNDIVDDLFTNRLNIEGKQVHIPDREDLVWGIKYSEDESERTLTLQVDWSNESSEPEAVAEQVIVQSKPAPQYRTEHASYGEPDREGCRVKMIWTDYTGHSESFMKILRKTK